MDKLKGLLRRIKGRYDRLPNALKAAWNTAWITFVGTFLTIIVGLLPALTDALSNQDFSEFTDQVSIAATGVGSAVTAFLVGIVNGLYRWARPITQSYQGVPDHG